MNKVSCEQHQSGSIELQAAILLYGTGKGQVKYATSNVVAIVNDRPVIGEGRALTSRSLRKFGNALLDVDPQILQFLPSNLLAIDDETMVWWVPPSKQRVFFKSNETGLKNAQGITVQPGLVFAKSGLIWSVYAVAGDQRPTPETELLFSPYFNVSDIHNICVGTSKLPKNRNVEEWTAAFFSSAFTHINYRHPQGNLKLDGCRPKLWRDLLAGKYQDSFPTELLPCTRLSLAGLIGSLQ